MYLGKPIQLLVETEDSFQLNIDALRSVLENNRIKDKHVVIISVAGEMRGGKSFMLDFFLRYLQSDDKENWLGSSETPLDGFSWKNGDDRDTTGILLWSEPHIVVLPSGEEYAVLLLDTQGTFDKKSMKKNAMIFALSTMVSSMQIFNVHKQVLEDKLQFLRLFTCYGRLAMSEGDGDEKPFQHLQFLIRDWPSPYKMPYGLGGGSQYLDKLLHVEDTDPDEIIEVRKFITQCFSRIDCCLMPHPGMKVMNSEVFDGRLSDIECNFVENLSKYVPTILSPQYLLPKAINGYKVTSSELLEYFKSYFKVFNSDEMPQPVDIFKATAEASNMAAVSTCKRFYTDEMEKICAPDTKYLSESKLKKEHARIIEAAVAKFDSTKKFGDHQHETSYRQELEKEIEESFLNFIDKNAKKNMFDREAWSLVLLLMWYIIAQLLKYVFFLVGLDAVSSLLSWLLYVIVLSAIVWGVAFWTGNEELRRLIDDVLTKSWETVLRPIILQGRTAVVQSLARNSLPAL